LIDLHKRHGSFGKTVQIGRQGLYVAPHERLAADEALRAYGIAQSLDAAVGSDHFADLRLLPLFGAGPILAADASDYEGATIVHDFNEPIAAEHHGQFHTLLELGSLEHIFNLPVALANLMRMLRLGGRLMSFSPANNWLGHGLYQLGPELMFRVFQPENGFRVESVRLAFVDGEVVELMDAGGQGYRNEIGQTVGATDLITVATKIADVEPFRRWPQQGDYAHAWKGWADQRV
jgi:hypothetical protein